MNNGQEPMLYGLIDAARALGVGRSTLYRLIAEGKIDARALGGRTVIPAESLRAFVAGLGKAKIAVAAMEAG